MKTELEVKFFPIKKNVIRKLLKTLGARLKQPETLIKRIVYDKRTNPQIQATYLRVRDEGENVRVSLKINATKYGKISDQKELDYIVSNFNDAKRLFDSIGLISNAYQENYRETWCFKNSEIVIDTWPSLDSYLEIESPNKEELKEIVKKLDLKWKEKKIVSVDELYAQKYTLTKEQALQAISYCTFKKPPKFS